MRHLGLSITILWSAVLVSTLPAGLAMGAQLSTLYSVARDDDQLRVIDLADGSTISSTAITITGSTVKGWNGLARHPKTGVVYGLVRLSEGFPPDRWLATLDTSTAQATLVGNTGARFAGIAFDSAGTLYAVTGDGEITLIPETLYTLNLATGAPTFVTILGNGGFGETIGFNPRDGFLYHASGFDDGIDPGTRIFEKIDLNTLATTDIPLSGDIYSELTALVFGGGVFFGADTDSGLEGQVFVSLSTNGVASIIGSTDHVAKGLVFEAPAVQTPSLGGRGFGVLVIALLAIGAAAGGGLHRRATPRRSVG